MLRAKPLAVAIQGRLCKPRHPARSALTHAVQLATGSNSVVYTSRRCKCASMVSSCWNDIVVFKDMAGNKGFGKVVFHAEIDNVCVTLVVMLTPAPRRQHVYVHDQSCLMPSTWIIDTCIYKNMPDACVLIVPPRSS